MTVAATCKRRRRQLRQDKRSKRFFTTRQRAVKNEPAKKGAKK